MSQCIIPKLITVTLTATKQKISSSNIKTSSFELHTVSTNAGAAYFGDKDVSTSNIPIAASTTKTYSASTSGDLTHGDYFDLSQLYLVGTAADVVRIQYYSAGNA